MKPQILSGSAVFVFPGCGLWSHGCSGRRRARPPARLGVLTSLGAAPRSPPVPSGPSGALHTSGTWCADVWLGASPRSPAGSRASTCSLSSVSHAIPLRLVQTLNLYRRNCNVFGVSRKMTAINYVRNVGGGGVVAAHGCRSQVLPLLVGVTGAWCAWFLGCFGACCYKRRQSRVFFVWISAPLLQTSSIQRLFR